MALRGTPRKTEDRRRGVGAVRLKDTATVDDTCWKSLVYQPGHLLLGDKASLFKTAHDNQLSE